MVLSLTKDEKMAMKRTPNPRAAADRDREEILLALYDKLAADDPAWAQQLPQAVSDAVARRRTVAPPR